MSRCFVIGNGASLNKHDLSKLKGETTIAANAFFHNPILKEWQPTYYCIIDKLHFAEPEFMEKFLGQVTETVTDTTFLFPLKEREKVEKIPTLAKYRKWYISFKWPISAFSLERRVPSTINFFSGLPGIQSVSQMGIMLGLYLGCNQIYLMGMDHDWLSYPSTQENHRMYTHFYPDQSIDEYVNRMVKSTYKTDIENVLKLWNGYEHLEQYAKNHNVDILNATGGGFLDVFRRVKYADLF